MMRKSVRPSSPVYAHQLILSHSKNQNSRRRRRTPLFGMFLDARAFAAPPVDLVIARPSTAAPSFRSVASLTHTLLHPHSLVLHHIT